MVLTIQTRSVYGNDLHYPTNDDARLVCALLGTKTIPDWAVRLLVNGYGHTVEEQS
jgi:hypothetical protein